MTELPERLAWVLGILRDAHPATVEPQAPDMKKAAHWAWSLGLAHRHITSGGSAMRITYGISPKGLDALAVEAGQ